jgi:MFS family permease
MGSEMTVLVVVLCGFFLVVSIVASVFFLLSLQRALQLCAPANRSMEPGEVWLCLIPLLNFVWIFLTITGVSGSLRQEFESRNSPQDDYGRGIGLAYCILMVTSIIPLIGVLTGLAGMVCWIIYWARISGYSRTLERGGAPEPAQEASEAEEPSDLVKAWVVLLILMFALGAQHLQSLGLSWFVPALREQFRLPPTDLGLVFAAYTFGLMAGYVVMTVITALCGTRWGLVVALAGASLTAAGWGLASGAGGIIAVRAALGFFAGGTLPAAIQSLREYFPAGLRPLAIGFLTATFAICSLLLLPLRPYITAAMGWQTALMLAGIPTVIAAGLCWFVWQPPASPGVSRGVSGVAVVSVVMLAVGFLLVAPLYIYAQSWLPILAARAGGVKQAAMWNYNWVASAAGAIAAGGAAWAMVRAGISGWKTRAALLTLLGLIMPVAIAAGTFVLEGQQQLVSPVVIGAFEGWLVLLLLAVADTLPARGVCIGVATGELVMAIMMTVSSPVLGRLMSEAGGRLAAGALAALAACGVLCVALLAWLVHPEEEQPSSSIVSPAAWEGSHSAAPPQ